MWISLPSLPRVGNRDIWVLVVVRRELCALDQVKLTLLAYFLWVPSWCSVIIC